MKQIELAVPTDPQWVRVLLQNFDAFMADHADCERKASAMAMRLVAKCADRDEIIPALIDLAIEELGHFREVYALMKRRGLALAGSFTDDPYVNRLLSLLRHGREERFLDHLLILGIIESRGAERFGIVQEALEDAELKAFYRRLYVAETKHGSLFLRFALKYFSEDVVRKRLEALLQEEGKIIQTLEWRPSLH
jgi:tRNA-(ms[2]io[6]A)-hydroxylase